MFLQGPGTVGLGSWLSVAVTRGKEVIPEADGEQKVEGTRWWANAKKKSSYEIVHQLAPWRAPFSEL